MPLVQDIVLGAGSAIFGVLLLPTLFDARARVPLTTSLTTGILLAVEAAVFLSLGLAFTTVTTAFAALTWLLVAKFRRPSRDRKISMQTN